ncbi:hypothetical protein HT585_14140 [Ensifer sp. HO-A22]|uniref:NADH:flavin oxidoreductase/NADH oxidase N-terminal domain-containing protein n=1 Tax=Ensifer oleiphilus TaxID=2742698 RepID=A0A7Y6Q6J7_9HYPH|nr:hypothetical protein [Ensifer oleiphilus]NVD40002.1 hypothetical protein [Ensifer oleiphilus]
MGRPEWLSGLRPVAPRRPLWLIHWYHSRSATSEVAAGFDGVEIHRANGHPLQQFLNITRRSRRPKCIWRLRWPLVRLCASEGPGTGQLPGAFGGSLRSFREIYPATLTPARAGQRPCRRVPAGWAD